MRFGIPQIPNASNWRTPNGWIFLLLAAALGGALAPVLVGVLEILIPNFEHSAWLVFGLLTVAATSFNSPARGLRVALYGRVSTEDQAIEGYSIDAQMRALRAWATNLGHKVSGEYIDAGHSGRKIRRPAYQRMLKEQDKWDAIVVLKMDRIHRNSRNFAAMMDQLVKAKKEFASVMENLDTSSAMGRFVMDIIQRIAQLESEQLGERLKIGWAERRKQTNRWHGQAPFGYELAPDYTLTPGKYAHLVPQVFQRFNEGASCPALAAWLSARATTGGGGKFTYRSIWLLLRNETYLGIRMSVDRVDTHTHPPLVDYAPFLQVERVLSKTAQTSRNVPKSQAWIKARREAIEALGKGEEYHADFQ